MNKIIICEADSLILTDLREIAATVRNYSGAICCMSLDDAIVALGDLDRVAAFLVRVDAERVAKSGVTEMVQERGGKVIWLGGESDAVRPEWRSVPSPFTSELVLQELRKAVSSADPTETGPAPEFKASGAQCLCG